MRWPRWRRKPRKPLAAQRIDRAIGQAVADADADGLTIAGRWDAPELGALLDARRPWDAVPLHELIGPLLADATETIPNPHAEENPVTTPEPPEPPLDDLDQEARNYLVPGTLGPAYSLVYRLNKDRLDARHLADAVRDVRDAKAPFTFTTQIDGVKIARCDTRGRTDEERAEYQRGLRDATSAEPAAGSAAWLRDLADRLQQYGELIDMADPEEFTTTPRAIRSYADKTERQAAADTRDRERVTAMLREQATYAYNSLTDTVTRGTPFSELANEIQNAAIDDALKVYRAGRDDREEQDRG